jgi:hypothetical protein
LLRLLRLLRSLATGLIGVLAEDEKVNEGANREAKIGTGAVIGEHGPVED